MTIYSADQFPHTGDGIYLGVDAEAYHAHKALSASKLSLLAKSPAHYRYAEDHPQPSTQAQIIGEAVHKAVLEPSLFAEYYTLSPLASRRSKAYDQTVADAGGAHRVLLKKEYEEIYAMRSAIQANANAHDLLGGYVGAFREVTLLAQTSYTYEDTGEVVAFPLKARLDVWDPAGGVIVDLKTTRDASPEAFSKALYDYGYYRQLAFYRYMAKALIQAVTDEVVIPDCYIVAVEKTPPYPVVIYRIDDMALQAGWDECRALLERHHACHRSGVWPGYATDEQALTLPQWAWPKLKA